ncbi:MAG: acyltransferase [Sphingobacteriia bacterium]|nr:MAG: acyltransferase [Sphingobacteriia bacterium]TAH06746.1 MAG: acyltransferase [Sphingobacteriia bacterium]
MQDRKYFIDWIRVIAIALLMVYHVAIVFQPWGLMIGFMVNTEPWDSLWIPMTMLNVWRIPILFFIAGIGVFYSFKNRNWHQLLKERGQRIGIPLVFGIVFIAPVYLLIIQNYYDWKLQYIPQASHLWFLGNILCYVILSIVPLYYIKREANSLFVTKLRKLFSNPIVFLIVIICFVLETIIVNPPIYEMYASTTHGFFLGWLAFIFGCFFAISGEGFWNNLVKFRWLFMPLVILFFIARVNNYVSLPKKVHLPIETCLWVFTIFSFAKQYLNIPHRKLTYYSKAAYPVYILHMIFLGLSCSLILPLELNAQIKFYGVLTGTIVGSLLCYELIKRIKFLSILFGIKK